MTFAHTRRTAAALTLLAVFAAGCANDTPEGAPGEMPQAGPPPPADAGVVLEAIESGGYTYVRVDAAGEEIWAAGPLTPLEVGDSIVLAGADNMGQFTSGTLDRTFEELYFVGAFVAPGAMEAAQEEAAQTVYTGTVLETMNAAGYTYVLVEVPEELGWLAGPGAEGPQVWLAGPESTVEVGNAVEWQGGAVMREFHSSTLDKTFPEILFVDGITVTG